MMKVWYICSNLLNTFTFPPLLTTIYPDQIPPFKNVMKTQTKMTGRTPEVRFDKILALSTFEYLDIWIFDHLTSEHLNIWTLKHWYIGSWNIEHLNIWAFECLNICHLNIWTFEHLNMCTFEHLNTWAFEELSTLIFEHLYI